MLRWLRPDVLGVAACFGVLSVTSDHRSFIWCLFLLGCVFFLQRQSVFLSFILCFLLFYVSASIQPVPPLSKLGDQTVLGRIQGAPLFDGDQLTLVFQSSNKEKFYGVMYVKTILDKQRLQTHLLPGEQCRISGKIEQPSEKRNPYGFDFRAYLSHQSIPLEMKINSFSTCQTPKLTLLERLERWRVNWIHSITSKFPSSMSELLLALVFGTKQSFTSSDLSSYQTLGISHLLAVSGLHIGLLTGAILFIFRRFGLTKESSAYFYLFTVLPLYLIMTGAAPSVLRAGCMITVLLVSDLFGRPIPPLNALILVGLFLLFLHPLLLYQISFQLSFVVTYLILFSWRILKAKLNRFLLLLTVSGIAQIGALPLTLFHFFQVSWISMGMNLIYVPFISFIILPLCFILVGLSWLPAPLLSFLIKPIDGILHVIQQGLTALATGAFGATNIGRPNTVCLLFLTIGVLLLLKLWERVRFQKTSIFLPLLGIACLVSSHFMLSSLNPTGKVVFLDVGQGDSIFIQLPHNGQTILIDTGGQLPIKKASWQQQNTPFEVGHDVVLNELKGMGITHLDLLVLSHRDVDHIGGAKGIVGAIPIKSIMVSPYFVPSASESIWLNKAKRLGTQLIIGKPGMQWKKGSATFSILWPAEKTTTSNGTSLVIKGEFGGKTWLFTGDLEVPEEKKMLSLYPNLHADILKVGHHGSKTASSDLFLKTIKPKLAIISVGKNNRYGHPHQEVINRLRNFHIGYLRTDETGGIVVTFSRTHLLSVQPTIKPKLKP